jgi:hypothetical protein
MPLDVIAKFYDQTDQHVTMSFPLLDLPPADLAFYSGDGNYRIEVENITGSQIQRSINRIMENQVSVFSRWHSELRLVMLFQLRREQFCREKFQGKTILFLVIYFLLSHHKKVCLERKYANLSFPH